MHYSTLIITAEKPTEADIDQILEPFNEDPYYNKLSELEKKYGEEEAYKHIEHPILMWDWYAIGGRWDKTFKTKTGYGRNIVPIDDLANLDEIASYNCIDDVCGEVITRSYWDGNKFIDDNDYADKLAVIKERSKGKGYYATMVDIHD